MSAGVDAAADSGLPIEVHRLPTYIDRVANALQLSIQYRAELHAFKELVLDLPPGFWRVSIYQQASIYRSIQLSEELREDVASVKSDVKVVSSQLSKQFVLSVEQRDEILSLCKALVIDGVRYDYNFADEALAKMKNAEAFPLFAEVFRSKSNTKTVQQAVRRHASYARNAYRMHLRDSVFGAKKRCSLTACARQVSRKFGNGDEPAVELILRIAILRHFIRRHPELVAREADPWDPDQEGSESADGASSDDSTGSGRARKRKKTTSTVHFWGAFMEFLEAKNRLWGKDIRSGGWATYVEDCLAEERRQYPDDVLAGIPLRQSPQSGLQRVLEDADGPTDGGTSSVPSIPFTFRVASTPFASRPSSGSATPSRPGSTSVPPTVVQPSARASSRGLASTTPSPVPLSPSPPPPPSHVPAQRRVRPRPIGPCRPADVSTSHSMTPPTTAVTDGRAMTATPTPTACLPPDGSASHSGSSGLSSIVATRVSAPSPHIDASVFRQPGYSERGDTGHVSSDYGYYNNSSVPSHSSDRHFFAPEQSRAVESSTRVPSSGSLRSPTGYPASSAQNGALQNLVPNAPAIPVHNSSSSLYAPPYASHPAMATPVPQHASLSFARGRLQAS